MSTLIYVCLPLAVVVICYSLGHRATRTNLPPGPRPLPIIGNLLHFPRQWPWVAFAKWGDEHGDVSFASFLGKPTLILNSRKACIDLLEKRSAIYSDRPRLVMLGELMGFNWNIAIMRYSIRWREHRRLFHQFFNETTAPVHHDVQERSARALLHRLLHKPESFMEHIRLSFAEIILYIVYNIEVKDRSDPYVRLVEEAVQVAANATLPGRYLVDLVPILKYVPSWMPGAGFRKKAEEWKTLLDNSKELPARYVRRDKNSSYNPSIFSLMMDKMTDDRGTARDSTDSAEEVAKNAAAMAYLAGADTTLSVAEALFMVLANHPEVQEIAQKELDSVVGQHRLPTFHDLQDLVYINAIVKEILRWHTPLPLGVAHCSIEDDEYRGYFIPKGTTVLPNIWRILHDPDIYPNPFAFNPSRWLIDTPYGVRMNHAIPDPDIATFGFGRRICPGQYLARNSLFIVASNVLSCFKISPLDEAGNPATRIEEQFKDQFLTCPVPFKVSFTPRSETTRQLIEDSMMQSAAQD